MVKKNKSTSLADYIRPALEAKYATQIEAARDIGVSQSRLSIIINRKSPAVSAATIERICDKLGLNKKEGVARLRRAKELRLKQFYSKPTV